MSLEHPWSEAVQEATKGARGGLPVLQYTRKHGLVRERRVCVTSKLWQQGQQGLHLQISKLGRGEEDHPCLPGARTPVLLTVFACIAVAVYTLSLRLSLSPLSGEKA
jgi:hypothetical protein